VLRRLGVVLWLRLELVRRSVVNWVLFLGVQGFRAEVRRNVFVAPAFAVWHAQVVYLFLKRV
jgi:hypothetical protein